MSVENARRYTDRAAAAVFHAVKHADAALREEAGVDDLLIGLLVAGDGVALRVLQALGIDRESLLHSVGGGAWRPGVDKEGPATSERLMRLDRNRLSGDARTVLAFAAEDAGVGGHLGTEHILIGLMRHGAAALAERGVTLDKLRAETDRQLAAFHSGRPTVLQPATADELIAIPRVSLPADIAELDERICDVLRRKEDAVDAEDWEAAASVRDEEKALRAQRAARVKDWAASVDLPALVEEVEALRDAVDRLRAEQHRQSRVEPRGS